MSPLLTVEVYIRRGLLPHTSLLDFIELIRFKTVHSGLKGLDVVLPGKDDILLQGLLLGHACEGVLELGNTLLIRKRCILWRS